MRHLTYVWLCYQVNEVVGDVLLALAEDLGIEACLLSLRGGGFDGPLLHADESVSGRIQDDSWLVLEHMIVEE